jgi:mono/diheme cytochrome c family protein
MQVNCAYEELKLTSGKHLKFLQQLSDAFTEVTTEGEALMRGLMALNLALFLLIAGPLHALAQSGCIGCHTDEATLKKLFVPPKAGPSEGEG